MSETCSIEYGFTFTEGGTYKVRHRAEHVRAALWGLCIGSVFLQGIAFAQPAALPGISAAGVEFDPNNAHAKLPEPQGGAIIHPPTISPKDYDMRKTSVGPRAPATAAGPQVVNSAAAVAQQPLAAAPSLGFEGLPKTLFDPPSANVAAGPKELIEVINSRVGRFDKSTGVLIGSSVSTLTWFQDLFPTFCPSGVVDNCIIADVQVRYDQIHGHFIITAQVRDPTLVGAKTSHLLISVSKGATWDGGWKNWALDATVDGTTKTQNWADFPQVGFDDKALYIAPLMFSFDTNTFQYSKMRIISKSDLYKFAATLPFKDFAKLFHQDGTLATTVQPMHVRGRLGVGPPPHMFIAASDNPTSTYYTLWTIDDPASFSPTLTRYTITNVWPYAYPESVPQLGSTTLLDTGFSSILKAVYREGFIYTAQNAKVADQPATVIYNRIDAALLYATLQSRLTNGNFFYPSLDVPASLSPANSVPPFITGTTTAPDGTLTYAGIMNTKAGEDQYNVVRIAPNVARWGDYFGGAVDPINGGMWVSGEYAKLRQNTAGLYGTWISYFPWNTVPRFSDLPASAFSYHYINALATWGVTNGCGSPTAFCPSGTLPRDQMAALLVRSIWGDTFTYTLTPYFTDVPTTNPLFKYVQKLRDAGLTNGCGGTLFCPSSAVTREQAAAFVIRAKMNQLFGDAFGYPAEQTFNDVPTTALLFPYVQKMAELGYTNGCSAPPNPLYCPASPITREQAAVFLVRAFLN